MYVCVCRNLSEPRRSHSLLLGRLATGAREAGKSKQSINQTQDTRVSAPLLIGVKRGVGAIRITNQERTESPNLFFGGGGGDEAYEVGVRLDTKYVEVKLQLLL